MQKRILRYTFEDIVVCLKESGIKQGDTIFFTTGLGMIGVPPEGIKNLDDLNIFFLEAIKRVLGKNGNIFVPAYSYTFGKSTACNLAIFDPVSTPAEIGSFPNFFLKQKRVIRTTDPMVSVAGLGPKCNAFFENIPNNSYAEGSFFSRLVKSDAKCCSIGLGPNWTPFIHYADWLYKVPFRYDKLFYGLIKNGNRLIKTPWIYSVRILCDESMPNAYNAARLATKAGIWNFAPIGRARIYSAKINDYFEFVCSHLEKDKWFLAKGSDVDVVKIEKARISSNYQYIELERFDLKEWSSILTNMKLNTVSDGIDNVLLEIKKLFEGKITKFQTGEWILDYIVPEKWGVKNSKIIDLNNSIEYFADSSTLKVRPYSLEFTGEVTKEKLLKHINAKQIEPLYLNRDWGFIAKKRFLEKLSGNKYFVKIESWFSFDEMKYLELKLKGRIKSNITVFSYVNNEKNKIAGLISALKLYDIEESAIRYVFVSDYIGYLAWQSKNNNFKGKIIHLGLSESEIIGGGNPHAKNTSEKFNQIFLNATTSRKYQNLVGREINKGY